MKQTDRSFWPFRPRASFASSIAILAGLLLTLIILKKNEAWPIQTESDTVVLIGLAFISLLPVLLAILDVIIERGGVIEYGGVKIDFSSLPQLERPGFTVPANIGVPTQPVNDSSTTQILDALKRAAACEVITIDLGEGQAWWETRLLVLLAGAVRLGRPKIVVFVGNEGGVDGHLQGWSYTAKLLPLMLNANPQYMRSYHAAQAAARQWALVEPINPPFPADFAMPPAMYPLIQPGLASQHSWMAFDNGLPNTLLAEQLLASDLGQKLESEEGPRPINLIRLKEIFIAVLYRCQIDSSWPEERQMAEFFSSASEYVAITQAGRYQSLVSRLSLLNEVVGVMADAHIKGRANSKTKQRLDHKGDK